MSQQTAWRDERKGADSDEILNDLDRVLDGLYSLGPRPESDAGDPSLVFTDLQLTSLVEEIREHDTIILADEHNYRALRGFRGAIRVVDASLRDAEKVRSTFDGTMIIGVGGCTALDVARYCATPGRRLIAIPSILSTSCISVNRSVLYQDGEPRRERTVAPERVVVSFPLLTESGPESIAKWSHSGFGDLFSDISASIDWLVRSGESPETVTDALLHNTVPCAAEAMHWVLSQFRSFDRAALARLAVYLHNASLETIHRGNAELSAAGEHDLYYAMMKQERYAHENPTHGELVAIGTLLSADAVARSGGSRELIQMLREAFLRLGLPTTYSELERIRVRRDHVLRALDAIQNRRWFLSGAYARWSIELVDRVFAEG